jgi:hypothetical protein
MAKKVVAVVKVVAAICRHAIVADRLEWDRQATPRI